MMWSIFKKKVEDEVEVPVIEVKYRVNKGKNGRWQWKAYINGQYHSCGTPRGFDYRQEAVSNALLMNGAKWVFDHENSDHNAI